MKMTVGPLPAGVYWRRRAIVGGVVLACALMLWASCGGGSDPADKMTQSAASAGAPPTSAEPATTLQVFTTGDPVGTGTSAAPAAPPSSAAPQVTGSMPACTDADLSLIAVPEQPMQYRGAYLKFTLKIKNVSPHECARDVGADAQELYLQASAASKVWSSDACDPPHGTQMSVLKPGIEVSFSTTWNGKATNGAGGCTNREPPAAGKYELVARLGTKISEPVQVQLT